LIVKKNPAIVGNSTYRTDCQLILVKAYADAADLSHCHGDSISSGVRVSESSAVAICIFAAARHRLSISIFRHSSLGDGG
jgi:hypothetical protein